MSKLIITHTEEHSLSAVASNRIEMNTNFQMGPEGYKVQFALICQNLPIGTQIGFSAEKPGTDPAINLPQTTISISPGFIAGMICQVPANYSSVINYYAIFDQPVPPSASITFQASIIV